MKRYIQLISGLTIFAMTSGFSVFAAQKNNETCDIVPGKPITNSYGPYDYTNPAHLDKLPIVLTAHFTAPVERLIKGNTGKLPHDIDYTLRAIPNYHRALNSMAKFERARGKPRKTFDRYYSIDCYFKRAIYFQPNDATTKMLYGIHKHTIKDFNNAEKLYKLALQLAPTNPEVNYNLGLLYVDLGKLDDARKHAKIAYGGGYPLPGLQNRIQKAEKIENGSGK